MIRNYLAGAVITFAMMSGMAFAQGVSTETTTTRSVTSPLPPVSIAPIAPPQAVDQTQSQTTIDGSGREIYKSQSYKTGNGRTEASSSTVVKEPDGSVRREHREEWQVAPSVQTTTSSTTTTTTDTDR